MGAPARNLSILVIFWWLALLVLLRFSSGQEGLHGAVLSSFSRRNVRLRPFDWAYMRVELPPWFSTMTINFLSNANIDKDEIKHLSTSKLPVLCFKSGSPPIPDISDTSLSNSLSDFMLNGYIGGLQNISDKDQCIPFQKNLTVAWTNEQISSGIWYIGFFNGLGSARTQSQMISRGIVYTFSTSVTVEGCSTTVLWGPYCNQTIDMISCSKSSRNKYSRSLSELQTGSLTNPERYVGEKIDLFSKQSTTENDEVASNTTLQNTAENLMTCYSSDGSSCLSYAESNTFFLDIVGMASHFVIMASDFKLNQTSPTNLGANRVLLMSYARHSAMPLQTLYDFSVDLSTNPLIVKSPKAGRWYITLIAVNQIDVNGSVQETYFNGSLCYSLKWQVPECLSGKSGLNCTWKAHTLQRTPRYSNVPYEAYYLPVDESMSDGHTFSLENLLSNDSNDQVAWTYLFLDIPSGAAGTTMHIHLSSDAPQVYEIYSRFGGLPSTDTWDFFINSTNSSHDSIILVSDGSKGNGIDFYVPYAREGTWCLGLKHPFDSSSKYHSTMLIALDGCPRNCNHNGKCRNGIDESGSTIYSYCGCDRDHGGFDCGDVLISPKGHAWHSIFLIASNAAAILPAFLALRQKAFAEWVLFTSSGISSGLYHACDVGTWCVLSFGVLQFMDFWLSFMAVVSTFIYMATIDEASKRAIHTCLAILTALLAITGATRSANIGLVIAIGSLGLLFGWFLEFSTAQRVIGCPMRFDLNIRDRWQITRDWLCSLWTDLLKKFHWQFLVLGLFTLAMAATSWKLETNKNYWIWHSLWHITIYTSSFFFLCSLRGKSSSERQQPAYELTRQDSSSRT